MHEPLTSGLPSGGGKSGIESLCVKTPPDSKPPDVTVHAKKLLKLNRVSKI